MMPNAQDILIFVGRLLYLTENIILLYIFLTPRRSRSFQAFILIATFVTVVCLRPVVGLFTEDFFLKGYLLGLMYLIPCALIFKETIHAKVFVFFMNYSLTQFTFLIFMHIDRYLAPTIPRIYVFSGLLLELAALPLVSRYLRTPIRSIIGIIDQKHTVFTFFPILSFMLLAYYAVQRTYLLSTFITLVLSTSLIIFSYYLMTISISAARRQQELEFISNTDSLTGLYNRRHMEQRINEEFGRYHRTGSEFALIISDIDFFKNINDRYGHDCGDNLLKSIANDIVNTVRTNDIVSRWGGEEFLFLLPVTNDKHAIQLAERIRKIIESRRYVIGGKTIGVTLTFGISVGRPEDTPDSVIKRADIALYHGKRNDRNCVILFDDIEEYVIADQTT